MKVGVIGAGTMGYGIAQAFAVSDSVEEVYLCDVTIGFANKGYSMIQKNIERLYAKGKIDELKKNLILGKIKTGLNNIAADSDLIIEAVVEKMEIKKKCFHQLQDEIVKNDKCIYATNTSSLSITEMGAGLSKPIIGMHFFNPAPVMKLVEVIPGLNTPADMVERIKGIAKEIGKVPVEVKEGPGFVVNRVFIPFVNEAVIIYESGLSDIESIDTAMRLGLNHQMGPLELGDLVGLDIVLAVLNVLYDETGDPKYRPSLLLKKMVRGGRLGIKTGRGFYDYSDGKKTPIDRLGL